LFGDETQIAARRVQKQENAQARYPASAELMRKDCFPRVWLSSLENRDLR
jgi:hypothetical protein